LQREKLEKQVEERTQEISLKNNDLELQKKQILAQSEKLSLQKQDLEELNSMKDKMFSIIAHDLKNPFNSVIGFSDILLQKYNSLSEEKKLKYIQLIRESSGKIYRLLENLLIWSRAQIHVLPFNPEETDLHDLIMQNVKLLEADYWKKNINMIVNIPLPITVYCDINMMNSVIRNLITNAIKFTNNNGVIEISQKDHDKYTEIIVKDNGIGIDKANISKLFKVGNSLKKQGTSGEEGTGLGLLLCKEFVNKHLGEIWVESQKGVGSAFHFTLPKNNP
jgi:signal transduction histidine kinase